MPEILIVDGELPIQKLIEAILAPQYGNCSFASNAAEAREILRKQRFDLLISDINMPDESGLALSQFVLSKYIDTAVIIMTGLGDSEVVKCALEVGAYNYLAKPIEKNTLLFCVNNALKRVMLESENRKHRENLESLVVERTANLQLSERRFRQLIEGSIQGILIHKNHKPLFVNQTWAAIHGYTIEEILKMDSVVSLMSPNDQERMVEYKQARLRGEYAPDSYEYQGIRKDGSPIWLENRVMQVRWHGEPAIQTIIVDISERKLAEEALRESEEKFRVIASSAQEAIIMMDHEGRISYWNAAAEKMFGYCGPQALKKDLHSLIAPARHHEKFRDNFGRFQETGCGHAMGQILEMTATGKDGKEFPVELSLSALKLKCKWHALGIIRDISDRKILETQLVHAQKMESIGQLAAGIAHEINTPIQYVGYNTQFLKEQFGQLVPLLSCCQALFHAANDGKVSDNLWSDLKSIIKDGDLDLAFIKEEIPPAIDQSLEGVARVSEIVRAMKEFSHPGSDGKTPIDINRAIESTITVARNEWKYAADITTDLDAELPLVPCLPADFNQVILNMIVNAAHAIGDATNIGTEKGVITIQTTRDNGWAQICITDTGTGIAAEHQSRIFDPFFTTKEVGKGTGQGLAISHSIIVDKHRGTLNFETEVGRGTTFIIRLPIGQDSN